MHIGIDLAPARRSAAAVFAAALLLTLVVAIRLW